MFILFLELKINTVTGSSSALNSFPSMGLENTETVSSKLETLQKNIIEKMQNVLLEKDLNKEADITDCNVENKKKLVLEFREHLEGYVNDIKSAITENINGASTNGM